MTATQEHPTLPAMATLGDLREIRPTIIIDSREQLPLTFTTLPSVTGTLQTADYSLVGCETRFGTERKSLDDIASCVCGESRARFERELVRLRGYDFRRLLIIGTEEAILRHEYRSNVLPKSVLHSLWAFEARYLVPVVFADTPAAGARLIERWAYFYAREVIESANNILRSHKKITPTSNEVAP